MIFINKDASTKTLAHEQFPHLYTKTKGGYTRTKDYYIAFDENFDIHVEIITDDTNKIQSVVENFLNENLKQSNEILKKENQKQQKIKEMLSI